MTDAISTALAGTFRSEMGRQQITQRQLAKMTGLSQSVISRRTNGKDSMNTDELTAIIDALNLDWTSTMSRAFDEAARQADAKQSDYGLVAHAPTDDVQSEQEGTEENQP